MNIQKVTKTNSVLYLMHLDPSVFCLPDGPSSVVGDVLLRRCFLCGWVLCCPGGKLPPTGGVLERERERDKDRDRDRDTRPCLLGDLPSAL